MNEKFRKNMWLRIFCIAIVVCFAAGLVIMLCVDFATGLIPWFAAMVIGAITLYAKRAQDKKAEDLAREEEEERAYQAQKQGKN